ncbi:radical SAM domain protein [Anaerocolumna cellulosilytica]|uniref:Radical SAM domain protein n=1 Tax=Anaerocolumna cellulosilytica TaxID=433286 RepID=A0A6S6QZM0_9FIRM|nr:radical SAM protein [Anaerocolumna cellulosilytica]MBB5194289.1 radical SAM protein with 4Fe4S-binding SPASM domain [Anaerocolumna cellulosilytica]BCJ94499.1 radical SAM domain protein [Anaerocolumna cellulosilytica]
MKRFKKIYIEITNACNLSCSFCPQTKRQGEFMKEEFFEQILKQIKPYTDYIYLHVKGEPLLHERIGDFLAIAGKNGFYVNITTNGTLIKRATEHLLYKSALRQINFSIHSFGGKEGIACQDYIEDILESSDRLQRHMGTFISYRFWNLNQNPDTELNCKNRAMLRAIEAHYGLDYEIKQQVIPGRGLKIKDKVYINQDFEFRWPALTEKEDAGIGFCHGLRNQAAILVDGTVIPCCLDGEGIINLGNLKDNIFGEIIESKRAKTIYDGFSKRIAAEELCKKCGYRQKFGM